VEDSTKIETEKLKTTFTYKKKLSSKYNIKKKELA
jgi:hypothetical protein